MCACNAEVSSPSLYHVHQPARAHGPHAGAWPLATGPMPVHGRCTGPMPGAGCGDQAGSAEQSVNFHIVPRFPAKACMCAPGHCTLALATNTAGAGRGDQTGSADNLYFSTSAGTGNGSTGTVVNTGPAASLWGVRVQSTSTFRTSGQHRSPSTLHGEVHVRNTMT